MLRQIFNTHGLECTCLLYTSNFGAGGKASAQLIADLFAKNFSNEFLDQGDDGARLPQPKGELIMATDSHVVSPIFFAGGDIGRCV